MHAWSQCGGLNENFLCQFIESQISLILAWNTTNFPLELQLYERITLLYEIKSKTHEYKNS